MNRFGILLAAATLAFSVGQASAHTKLTETVPNADATVTGVAAVELTFSEAVDPAMTSVTVKDDAGADVDLGKAAASQDGHGVAFTLPAALTPGVYEVTWRALSRDGHTVDGVYSFTVDK
ncbi:MAG: copper resistance protein CopC [Paracoccus denitrificans]|nr:MAG: copper resistance protein CopC [Paracoccus denitrificans]PZO82828.1 MAG: copper resistance protein CopC [Paracoccus denitrificans]